MWKILLGGILGFGVASAKLILLDVKQENKNPSKYEVSAAYCSD